MSERVFLGMPGWQTAQPAPVVARQDDVEGPVLGGEARALAARIVARYPGKRSALIPLLYLVQSEAGWVPRQGMREVAEILGLTTAEVEAVATFYTMLKLHPCGRYVISICTNPSCSVLGGRRLYQRAKEALGEDAEYVTADGTFTLEEEECLAACDSAPVVTVNYLYYHRVSEERLDSMIESIRGGQVPEASLGGTPGDLKAISRTLSGAASLRPPTNGEGVAEAPAPTDPVSDSPQEDAAADGSAQAALGVREGPAKRRENPDPPTRPSGAGGTRRSEKPPEAETPPATEPEPPPRA